MSQHHIEQHTDITKRKAWCEQECQAFADGIMEARQDNWVELASRHTEQTGHTAFVEETARQTIRMKDPSKAAICREGR